MNIKRIAIFILLAAAVIFSTNCSKKDDNNPVNGGNSGLVGTWNLTKATVTFSADSVVTVAPALLGMSMTLVVNSDNTYQISTTDSSGTSVENGTWSSTDTQITITPQSDTPATVPYTLSGNTLTITAFIEIDAQDLPAVLEFTKG